MENKLSPIKSFVILNGFAIAGLGGFALTVVGLAIAGLITFTMPQTSVLLTLVVLASVAFIVFGARLPQKIQEFVWYSVIVSWVVLFFSISAWQLAISAIFWSVGMAGISQYFNSPKSETSNGNPDKAV